MNNLTVKERLALWEKLNCRDMAINNSLTSVELLLIIARDAVQELEELNNELSDDFRQGGY